MATKPKRGERTAKHIISKGSKTTSVAQAKNEMGKLMHSKTNGRRAESQKAQRNKEHKYR